MGRCQAVPLHCEPRAARRQSLQPRSNRSPELPRAPRAGGALDFFPLAQKLFFAWIMFARGRRSDKAGPRTNLNWPPSRGESPRYDYFRWRHRATKVAIALIAVQLLIGFRLLVVFHQQPMTQDTKAELNIWRGVEAKDKVTSRGVAKMAVTNTVQHMCGINDIQTNTYAVCNGLSNQLAGHAGYIANLITSGRKVAIPDAFIFNGVQSESNRDGETLKNVVANKGNSIPFTSIIDADTLLNTIRGYGVDACFIPHDVVILQHQDDRLTTKCSWLEELQRSDNDVALRLLNAMKPSIPLSSIVESVTSNLQEKTSDYSLSEGVCLHHRDGFDWHKHCTLWKGNNCMNMDNRPIEDLVKDSMPFVYPKKWMYYVGDTYPSKTLVESMKKRANLELFHRDKDELASYEEIHKLVYGDALSLEKHRDIFAAIDFFVCMSVPSFIGNSVSTFSALQIAIRRGKNSSWYNSRSIPLLDSVLQAEVIPIVYTYTEESQAMGKVLLKASIISVRQTFGLGIDINIIYHGTEDTVFQTWLEEHNVIIHKHEPKWLWMVQEMTLNANSSMSHLYSHLGNYIGTWQRIDIPLFIDAEYVMFLDCDTIVRNKFDFSSFGNDITPGIAFSDEAEEGAEIPMNTGVALLNVPKLRETYAEFHSFIEDHVKKKIGFRLGPSDQGAYLDFYGSYKKSVALRRQVSTYVQYLDQSFNVKPYYKNKDTFDNRKVVHFHGLKPHDILKGFMGYSKDDFAPALQGLLPIMFGGDDYELLCLLSLHDFALSIVDDKGNLNQFCKAAFPSVVKEEMA
ncbi:hypothetical protein ACHAWF_003171, partial [Thalassiosira exigua]